MKPRPCIFELGDRVSHIITGFSGVVVARTEWLNGCWRVTVQPDRLDKDGQKPLDSHCFDQEELVECGPNIRATAPKGTAQRTNTGGPRNDAVALSRR